MIRVIRSTNSILDYAAILRYLLNVEAIDVGTRFSSAFDETLEFLQRFPDVGEAKPELSTARGDVRVDPVRNFPNYLIYFRRRDERLTVLRVVHAARNIDPSIFPDLPT